MVDVAKFFLAFSQDESCGKCTPCREGTKRMLEILEKITAGKGVPEDIDKLERLADLVKKSSLCGLGRACPNPVLSTLKYFREEYDAHVAAKRCPAKRCVLDAKDMAREKIFQDKRKTLHEIGAYTTLEILLNAFCGAALEQHGGRTPSFKNRRILDLLGNNAPDPAWPLHTSFLRMIDFIAGMTDSYATEMAREMTGRSSPQ
jgi:dGTP triphosphohydrolase